MKKLILIGALVFTTGTFAQILDPVKWETKVNKISDNEYELEAIATIDNNWHLYSQTVPDNGPIATSFIFEGNGNYLKKGNTKEEEGHTIDDPVFDMKIKFFETKASFKQRIRLKGEVPFQVTGYVEFMVCDDTRCLPPTEEKLVFNVE